MHRKSLNILSSGARISLYRNQLKVSIRELTCSSSFCDKSTPTQDHRQPNPSTFMSLSDSSQFLHQLKVSMKELEVTIGYSQQQLQSTLRSTMPLLGTSQYPTSTTADHQHDNTENNNVGSGETARKSIQRRLAPLSIELTKPFPAISSGLLQTFQQKLIDDELFASQCSAPGTSFRAIRPCESFLVLLLAHLMNPRLMGRVADQQSEPVRKHLFMLLNIIQLIRAGTNTRIGDCFHGQSRQQLESRGDKSASVDHYRWSIQKGNFYLYSVTYSLLRLNAQNVTNLMNTSLQSITAMQYWLEREATTKLIKKENQQICTSPAVRRQLAQGGLMPVWESVVASRDSCLLAAGCEAVAYLLGKENPSQYQTAMQLGTTLGQILSLLDDYCLIRDLQSQCSHSPPEHWTQLGYFSFLLRLPVLLYLKEANTNAKLELPITENKCHKMVLNVIAHIDESDALSKTRALIEHFVRIGEKQVSTHYEASQVRTTFLALLNTCASVK